MKILSTAILAALLGGAIHAASAATFNYHGNLQDAGKPANGQYDVELTLYSAAQGGKVVAGPLTMYKVDVHDGAFSTETDFAGLANVPQQAWLGVRVRGAGESEFASLDARAPVGADAVASAVCPGAWTLDGNAGNPSGSYLGTADNQDLDLRANNASRIHALAAKDAVSVAGAFINNSSGNFSVAISSSLVAAGDYSFAGGYSAGTSYAGSFVWGDKPATPHTIKDTGPNQFIVQAGGGMAVNGAPVDAGTELSLYPGTGGGGLDYSNIYLGTKGKAGIELSVGDESSSTSNDAGFYLDQYDGTHRVRKFIVNGGGATVNGNATINGSATVNGDLTATGYVNLNQGYATLGTSSSTNSILEMFAGSGGFFEFDSQDDGFHLWHGNGSSSPTSVAVFFSDGSLQISGSAYKPGGGSWSATSDRRIKQDIAPIENAVDTLLKLRPVSFRYTPQYRAMENNLPDKPYLGFVAQEFAQVFPEAVTSTGQHVPGAPKDAAPILALDPNPALITTVAAVQELAVQSQDDAGRVRKLEAENADLRAQVQRDHRTLDALAARLSALEHDKGN